MGCLGNSKTEDQRIDEKAQREANKKIEKQLQKERLAYKATHRLLLLGKEEGAAGGRGERWAKRGAPAPAQPLPGRQRSGESGCVRPRCGKCSPLCWGVPRASSAPRPHGCGQPEMPPEMGDAAASKTAPKSSPDPQPEPRITVFSLCFFLFQGLVSQEKALLWNKCESYMSMDLIQSKNYWHFVTYFSLNVGNRLTPGRLGAFPSHPLRFGGLTLRLGGGRGGGGARIRKLLLLYICIFSSWPLYCVLHCCYCSAWQAPV